MNSREALNAYIRELETDDTPWYHRAARFHYFMWNSLSFLPLLFGVASALVAALLKENQFQEQGKVWLIVLPLIGGFASTLLTKFKYDQMEDLRERGHLTISKLVQGAKIEEAAANDEECKAIHERLLERVSDLDLRQHEGAWAILKSPIK